MDSEQVLKLRVDLPGGGVEVRSPIFRKCEGGPTNKEEPSHVGRRSSAWSKYHGMGKQARGRGLNDEGSEEEEANGQMQTWSEVVSNLKDASKQQARKKV
ncbi:hypothetical protein PAXRUDRAFT_18869 [Paxillus rubicundulus Ve08.2h10]|uniref:Unplaced genomic scaffold scaffold_3184, whole genome shotgun sequence n=1 Tax=Paxillus rubicundulus Ve08.2h10 TaxID=930991 RepID=A0A0D0DDS1_9AGAM|nr:hypothetical protein PAXRUDRAFT_20392 [Paxillus rubicundulus Ve08.2h10]KIK75580.1 hypothetical protein PAXRUDRAFT_18869 [Paxillus rubicundulus Ve08.2h10]